MDRLKKEKIAFEVIRTLAGRFQSFPEDSTSNRNAPFHEAFLKAFSNKFYGANHDIPLFISLSSWLHGLNTTLGQSFFESTAHILSDGEKKSFTGSNRLYLSSEQLSNITEIITGLKNNDSGIKPSVENENQLLFIDDSGSKEGTEKDITIDVFYETDEKVIAIELKSVKPNAGEVRGEKQKALEAKAKLHTKFTNKEIEFYFGFPFDPTGSSDLDYDKTRFLNNIIDGKKYLDKNEVLLGPELWDFLAGENDTMQTLLDIINGIATKEFEENIHFINDKEAYEDFNNEEYEDLLNQWCLFREAKFRSKENIRAIKNSKGNRIKRKYNQDIIKTGKTTYGEYNISRLHDLNLHIQS